jgi:hypothetical protein
MQFVLILIRVEEWYLNVSAVVMYFTYEGTKGGEI